MIKITKSPEPKIQAIKELRTILTSTGLKEAKEIIDAIDQHGVWEVTDEVLEKHDPNRVYSLLLANGFKCELIERTLDPNEFLTTLKHFPRDITVDLLIRTLEGVKRLQ